MNRDDLVVDLRQIPIGRDEISENLRLLLDHARFIEAVLDVEDPLAKGLIETVPSYICKQLERLRAYLDDEPDLIAWISRNLMELFFTLRYMYSSRDRYDEVIKEQLKDMKDIEKVLYPEGLPSDDAPHEVKAFYSDMKVLWETVEKWGVKREDLMRPNQIKKYAEGANLLDQYDFSWRLHSKYMHPTSYLIFGKRSFVYSKDACNFFWVMAQYYAARNLSDLHGMIQAARIQS